jgi:UDP-N-acetylmuramoylalanine--D-glutamate ligase
VEYVHSSRARPPLPEGPFLVVGLARSGVAAARALKSHGEAVSGFDSGSPPELGELDLAGVEYSTGGAGLDALPGVGAVVKSPGVPKEAEIVVEARRRGIPVIGEMELGWRLVGATFVGITGTNGKTTTTELVAHILRTAGRTVHAVGNIGSPLTGLADRPLGPEVTVVCECSSFQLEDTEYFAPECAVYLNLAPDHLDRHGTMAEYDRIKQRIFINQIEGDVAVLNQADPVLADLDPPGEASVVRFLPAAGGGPTVDLCLEGGAITVDGRSLIDRSELKLIGDHNVANAMAAGAAALSLGLPAEVVAEGLRSFAGVAHRLEPVAEIGGVRFINDSKATNVEATVTALASFDSGVRLILGGSLKGEPFEPLLDAVRPTCSGVYLIGEAAAGLRQVLAPLERTSIPVHDCGDLDAAVTRAWLDAGPGETILLSPSCASFDQFRDFEDRGEHFRRFAGMIDEV